jgi:hypothetical protein
MNAPALNTQMLAATTSRPEETPTDVESAPADEKVAPQPTEAVAFQDGGVTRIEALCKSPPCR